MTVFVLFEVDQHKAKSSRIFLGVFRSFDEAIQAYKDNDGDEKEAYVVETILGDFNES